MSHPTLDQYITFIYTRNLEESARFYESIIGFALWRDQGTCRIYHISGGSYLGICQTGSEAKGNALEGKQQNVILTLVTEDVDGWYTHLQDKGIQFEHAPRTNHRYNIYHCFLRDPNGYLIEIQRFLD